MAWKIRMVSPEGDLCQGSTETTLWMILNPAVATGKCITCYIPQRQCKGSSCNSPLTASNIGWPSSLSKCRHIARYSISLSQKRVILCITIYTAQLVVCYCCFCLAEKLHVCNYTPSILSFTCALWHFRISGESFTSQHCRPGLLLGQEVKTGCFWICPL